ncbi:MAG: alanine dehydrogenase, partial [Bacilli bacterium]
MRRRTKIGIPLEIKNNENRVAITPGGVASLVANGHSVTIQSGAGVRSGYSDESFMRVGASIVYSAEEAWAQEMIVKVKEPIASEYKYFQEGLILCTYLHLAAEPE